jgi:hypothetical protein
LQRDGLCFVSTSLGSPEPLTALRPGTQTGSVALPVNVNLEALPARVRSTRQMSTFEFPPAVRNKDPAPFRPPCQPYARFIGTNVGLVHWPPLSRNVRT